MLIAGAIGCLLLFASFAFGWSVFFFRDRFGGLAAGAVIAEVTGVVAGLATNAVFLVSFVFGGSVFFLRDRFGELAANVAVAGVAGVGVESLLADLGFRFLAAGVEAVVGGWFCGCCCFIGDISWLELAWGVV